jgi:hypothetical protein
MKWLLNYSGPLVISAATGYSPSDLEPFLKSLYLHCPTVLVVLIANRQAYKFIATLKGFNPNVIIVTRSNEFLRRLFFNRYFQHVWVREYARRAILAVITLASKSQTLQEYLLTSLLHIKFSRYFTARRLIRGKFCSVNTVLLCDSRDVLFQDDPFSHLTADLVTGLEEYAINDQVENRCWIIQNYGPEGLAVIGNHKVICSGVTLARRDAVLSYLDAMCTEISEKLSGIIFQDSGDQAIHNWVIRKQNDNTGYLLAPNGHKLLATLIFTDLHLRFKLDKKFGLLTNESDRVAILHHYDRHDVIKDWCSKNGLTS